MRYNLLPALGTVLSLGAWGAIAADSPICDRPLDYNPSAEALKVAHDCIEDMCTAGVRSARQDCGPVLLTVRSNSASGLFEPAVCVTGFRNILDQCITAGSTLTGALLTRDLRFEIAVAGVPEHEEGIRRRDALTEEDDFEGEDDDEIEDEDEDEDESEHGGHKRLEARRKRKNKKAKACTLKHDTLTGEHKTTQDHKKTKTHETTQDHKKTKAHESTQSHKKAKTKTHKKTKTH